MYIPRHPYLIRCVADKICLKRGMEMTQLMNCCQEVGGLFLVTTLERNSSSASYPRSQYIQENFAWTALALFENFLFSTHKMILTLCKVVELQGKSKSETQTKRKTQAKSETQTKTETKPRGKSKPREKPKPRVKPKPSPLLSHGIVRCYKFPFNVVLWWNKREWLWAGWWI